MGEPVVVVAGVIERDGRILICQRAPGKWHALKWEFPGGKAEPGEEPPQALVRELEEELGIRAAIGDEMARIPFQYPDRPPILLVFLRVDSFEGAIVNREFASVVWETPERLPEHDFLEADVGFVRGLARSPGRADQAPGR
jgi:8-oxo-dGTP diphosphatase